MSTEQHATEIIQFIKQELLDDVDDLEIGEHDNLLQLNLIDSLQVMRLVEFISREFDVTIPPEDITIDNFRTANLLGQYVSSKRG